MSGNLPKGVRSENKSYIKWMENQKNREPWEIRKASASESEKIWNQGKGGSASA